MKDTATPKIAYISNPFVLAYRAAKRLYATNKGWAIVFIVLGILSSFQSNYDATSNQSTLENPVGTTIDPALVFFILIAVLVFSLLVVVITVYLTGLFSFVALQSEKGNTVSVGDAVRAVNKKFHLLLKASLLAGLKILGWTLLFIIPGIIASLRYTLLAYLIMDSDTEGKQAQPVKATHDRIKQLTKGRLWEVFGMSFTSIVPLAGTLFNVAGSAALYRQLQVYTDKKAEKPPIHWLNYLGAILLVSIVVIALLIALVALRTI